MTIWTIDELQKIGATEEIETASLRPDGSLRKPVTIWVVHLGDDIYVRSVNGRTSAWFRGALVRKAGQIRAGATIKDVIYEEITDPDLLDQVDTAYRTKYRSTSAEDYYGIVDPKARAATIRLLPRQA